MYDQSSQDVGSLSSDCFLTVLLGKLEKSFNSVHLLAGESGTPVERACSVVSLCVSSATTEV